MHRTDRGLHRLEIEDLEVVNAASEQPPSSTPQYLLELRSRAKSLVFKVQTTLEAAIREFVLSRDFIELHTPKISGGGSESGATVFSVPYFGEVAYLVQSPQFYMQMAMMAGLDRVFEIGPVFRSEAGSTPIHATEFTVAHFEMSWIDSHEDLMRFEEELLRHAIDAVTAEHGPTIEREFDMATDLPATPIPRFRVSEAPQLLGEGLAQREDERLLSSVERALSKLAHRTHGHSLVFISDYPASVRPFYTMQDWESSKGGPVGSRSFDLLWHGIEVTSGGQREHRFDHLEAQIGATGVDDDVIDAYIRPHFLEMFRHGCPPHGGFGIGLNRLMMALLGQASIRDTSFVFRGPRQHMP
jgi:aspartyl-tRNA synthetase